MSPERQAAKAITDLRAPAGSRACHHCVMDDRARLSASLNMNPLPRARRWMPALAAGLSIGEYARSLERRLALLAAVLLAVIWALAGRGYLWPAWAWLGPRGRRADRLGCRLGLAAPAGRRAPRRVRVGGDRGRQR